MFKMLLTTILFVFCIFSGTAFAQEDTRFSGEITKGKQYQELSTNPYPEREVIEFFSFNCPSCFQFETVLHASNVIKTNLPSGVAFKRYNLDDFGPLAKELAAAWAVANVLGIQEKISEPLYIAIHRDQKIRNENDIKAIFTTLGIDSATYDKTKSGFLVSAFLAQQKEAVNELKPNSIPMVFVNRRYLISPSGLDGRSSESFINDYARVAAFLSNLAPASR